MMLDAHLVQQLGALSLDARIELSAGRIVALLGPNASGKTTTLHALAGLRAIDAGHVRLDGVTLDEPGSGVFVQPECRPVSLVFQDYLLFPHLSARDNIAFGLMARGARREQARAEAGRWLERFGLADQAASRPRQLSGGQAQRVAIARALAPAPALLLLDEPLAALDAGTRASVRRDLRVLLREFAGMTVLVTHDPLDALALADEVVVLEQGRVVQAGPISELTTTPRSRYVADLVGLNLFEGTAHDGKVTVDGAATLTIAEPAEGPVYALVHPATIALYTRAPSGSPRNCWQGSVDGFELLGDRVRVRVAGAATLTAEITAAAMAELDLHDGQRVWATVKATEITTYPR